MKSNVDRGADGRPGRSLGASGRVSAFLTSPRLAIALLIAILVCSVVGVTVFRGPRGWVLIFSTLWFNALLVLLAISSAAAFFSRIWRRRLTVVQVGMILFHLSFAALLGGVVMNSLYHFRGLMRLTEGETLPNGDLASYDITERGRLFDVTRFRGTTTLLKMHPKYVVDGQDKAPAYDVSVGEPGAETVGTLFITKSLEHRGVRYIRGKEGFSVLVVMSDKQGKELYGAHVPLQSFPTGDGTYRYGTGSPKVLAPIPFPHDPEVPRFDLVVTYRPHSLEERRGEVGFEVMPLGEARSLKTGSVPLGGAFDAGDVSLSPREVRYWVGMDVRYDPGLMVILGSLWAALGGMVLTLVGRVQQGRRRTQ